jgi:hypothetical protein
MVLIDDSAENAFDASQADPPAKVLLFGQYPWNAVVRAKKTSKYADSSTPENGHGGVDITDEELDDLPYIEKSKRGLLERARERRKKMIQEGWIPEGVERVRNWEEVISWVARNEQR